MQEFTIREASTREIPLIRALTYEVWPQTYIDIIGQEQVDYMLELMYSERSLQEQFARGCRFLIIASQKEDLGFASFEKISQDLYKLHKLYVLPVAQGTGAGKLLVENICSRIKNDAGGRLELQVNRNNKALRFYQHLGFTIQQEANFDIGGGFYMNDYIMEKEIV